ncbi:beta-mannosidase [Polaribacter gangjinensis]|uniref:Beta-mannosidase B n=1 Tax=Polaribacter gangjinensis TaxID=574710 RepID=A0A2S7WEW9_9FLAO|nr:glycoside hydrolase family 2 protein [Polaribacter gangjinensis]PQJ76144.1 beta-mannosidase [Polaribacter gangjinensis]
MHKFLLFLLVLAMLSCENKNLPEKIAITTNWEFKGVDTLDWQSARVPGNIFSDLLEKKMIPNPFIKTNEDSVQWVSKKNWEYKTTFSLSKKQLQKKNIELHFEGLDTYATIYLNDSIILKANNAFKKYTIDIKKSAKESNNLRVVFENFNDIELKKEAEIWYKLPVQNRVYTRKAQFQYGWDWGPVLNSYGIWKEVSIKAWDDVIFSDIYIKQDSLTVTKAVLSADIIIESNIEKFVELETWINSEKILTGIHLKKGENKLTIPIKIDNPTLWWTHNLGKPYLYRFDFKLFRKNKLLDQKIIKKGIRTIKLIAERDTIGQSFYFELNGKPVYAKGANLIPMHSFQDKVTNEKYEKLLSHVVTSNMNMLRVWGGGIYENDIFYDLCDEKGILVWQDFMFACAMYPGDATFLQNVSEEAEYQVKRLRNHTSIALWCGNNENSEAWKRWGWQENRGEKEKQEIWDNYLMLFDSILPSIVAKNSNTDYWETSPKYGRGNPKYISEGDAHDWWIWHDEYPFEHLQEKVPRFMSEFGFQSFPSFETVKYINQKDEIDLKTNAIKSHQKHPKGFELIEKYMKRDYKIPTSDEDYVYVSQLLQAKGIVMGIEAQRRAKPYNMGTLYWQLNDCWPAISWSSIDYFGNWKALQYKAKKAFENVLISTVKSKNGYEIYIVNDLLLETKGTLQIKIMDFFGKEIWSDTSRITVKADASQRVYQLLKTDVDHTKHFLSVTFNNSSSFFYFAKPKDLMLPKEPIERTISKTKNGFSITLKSNVLQKDVFLFTSEKGHFSDNFFDLLPNTSKTIHFKSNSTNLQQLSIKSLQSIQE